MECSAHPGRIAVGPCADCKAGLCEGCATFELEGGPCCETCGLRREEDARELGAGLLGLISVAYLATLAVGVAVFKARPFVGGLAAIVAIAMGRALQMLVPARQVSRRLPATVPRS